VEPPEFVQRLTPDPTVARRAAFGLFVLTFLEQIGLQDGTGDLAERLSRAAHLNRHLFGDLEAEQLGHVDGRAALDLTRWAAAQRLDREEPQVAYELGLLALGVTLPPVLVGELRQLRLEADTRVIELPDGAGYPTVFLHTLHPHWRAGERATHLVTSIDAQQLAAWAHLLLTRRLAPRAGAIEHVPAAPLPEAPHRADVALIYNSPAGLDARRLVEAGRYVVV
jgi:hypothetical protein